MKKKHTLFTLFTLDSFRKKPNRRGGGVEDMEFPGVSKK